MKRLWQNALETAVRQYLDKHWPDDDDVAIEKFEAVVTEITATVEGALDDAWHDFRESTLNHVEVWRQFHEDSQVAADAMRERLEDPASVQ